MGDKSEVREAPEPHRARWELGMGAFVQGRNGGGCLEEVSATGLSQWLFLTGLVLFLSEVGKNRGGAGLIQEGKRSPSAGVSLRPG